LSSCPIRFLLGGGTTPTQAERTALALSLSCKERVKVGEGLVEHSEIPPLRGPLLGFLFVETHAMRLYNS